MQELLCYMERERGNKTRPLKTPMCVPLLHAAHLISMSKKITLKQS